MILPGIRYTNQRLFWSLNHLENWELGNPRFQKMPRTKTGSMYRSSTYQPHLIGFIDNLAIKQKGASLPGIITTTYLDTIE